MIGRLFMKKYTINFIQKRNLYLGFADDSTTLKKLDSSNNLNTDIESTTVVMRQIIEQNTCRNKDDECDRQISDNDKKTDIDDLFYDI
jgi:hypothetical protein